MIDPNAIRTFIAALPAASRVIALDVGDVKIGVAWSDIHKHIAHPGCIFPHTRFGKQALIRCLQEKEAGGVVIGLPLAWNGEEMESAVSARALAAYISKRTALPLLWHDERYTTQQAQASLRLLGQRRKERDANDDMIAATLLLREVLEIASR